MYRQPRVPSFLSTTDQRIVDPDLDRPIVKVVKDNSCPLSRIEEYTIYRTRTSPPSVITTDRNRVIHLSL